ncbi:MAG: NADH-dependent flavin oxidoreductase [Sutterellaceae bacterium]|nr:NADH-dependent flavin oxidoreductase [Sutterellaceae bacterium]MDY2868681.1 NADH-dependent flavin oxidoreductase [Mesosutterella sp.]
MNEKYASLFDSLTLNNGVVLKNRLAVAPLTEFGSNPDGTISDEDRAYYRGRAEGYGLFIAPANCVAPAGKAFWGQPCSWGEEYLESLRETASIIKAQGAVAVLQIHHGGDQAIKELIPNGDAVSASDEPERGVRAMTGDEVEATVKAFADAADLALRAGYDGVEIHGANQYLLQQFYSAHTNKRTDRWGGAREKRMAFPLAVADAVLEVREKHNRPDFVIGYRFSAEEPWDDGLTMEDTYALVDELAKRPFQYLHMSQKNFWMHVRRGDSTEKSRLLEVRKRIAGRMALIGVGGLWTADDLVKARESGYADLVAQGCAVLVNPGLPKLIEEGREGEIELAPDPARADRHGLPKRLWDMSVSGVLPWLPPVKKVE